MTEPRFTPRAIRVANWAVLALARIAFQEQDNEQDEEGVFDQVTRETAGWPQDEVEGLRAAMMLMNAELKKSLNRLREFRAEQDARQHQRLEEFSAEIQRIGEELLGEDEDDASS
jgi:hypothetical protein